MKKNCYKIQKKKKKSLKIKLDNLKTQKSSLLKLIDTEYDKLYKQLS